MKETIIRKLNVTGYGIDEIMKQVQNVVSEFRQLGWHFSAMTPIDWLFSMEDGEPEKYLIFTFCK